MTDAPERRPSVGRIVVGVVAGGIAIGAWQYVLRPRPPHPVVIGAASPAGASASAPLPPLVRTVTTKNGIVSVRYPDGFDVQALDDSTVQVVGDVVAVTVAALFDPMTHDVRELSRACLGRLEAKLVAQGARFADERTRDGRCLARFDGLEVDETVIGPDGPDGHLAACFFVHDRLFGAMMTMTTKGDAEAGALARAILDSTEIHPPAEPDPSAGTSFPVPQTEKEKRLADIVDAIELTP